MTRLLLKMYCHCHPKLYQAYSKEVGFQLLPTRFKAGFLCTFMMKTLRCFHQVPIHRGHSGHSASEDTHEQQTEATSKTCILYWNLFLSYFTFSSKNTTFCLKQLY